LNFSFHAIHHVNAFDNVSVDHRVHETYNSLLTNDLKNGFYLLLHHIIYSQANSLQCVTDCYLTTTR